MSDYNQGLLFAFGSLFLLGLGAFVYYYIADLKADRDERRGRRRDTHPDSSRAPY